MVAQTSLKQVIGSNVALLLSFNGGYVDTASFLALRGLFAAHVTGNFVTLGASLVNGTSGVVAKVLALPAFCLIVVATRLMRYRLQRSNLPVFKSLLLIQFLLLTVAAVLAVELGPFANADHASALLIGMTLVSAMAIQNAAHRVHLANSPPSTMMTGTTTQVMLDIADLLYGSDGEARKTTQARIGRLSATVVAFAAGCGVAALLYSLVHEQSFYISAAVALLAALFAPDDVAKATA